MFKNTPPLRDSVLAFARRTKRVRIENSHNGHCGVLGHQEFSRVFFYLPSDECIIRQGRIELANALRNNCAVLEQCTWYDPEGFVIAH